MDHRPIFHNFDIHITARVGERIETNAYGLSVERSLAGETTRLPIWIDLHNPFIQEALSRLIQRDISPQMLQDFGTRLADWLLPAGLVRNLYHQSLGMAEAKGHGLRVRLHIEPPELAVLPWEYMYDKSTEKFFALDPKTALVRYHTQFVAPAAIAQRTPISVLILMAEPSEVEPLPNSHEELLKLLHALKYLREQEIIQVDILYGGLARQIILEQVRGEKSVRFIEETLSIDALRDALRRNAYHVVHFIGHGIFDHKLGGLLLFTDSDNEVALVDAQKFAVEMRRTSALVILNACQSAQDSATQSFMGLAPRLIQAGIPAVVAMQYDILGQSAMDFSNALYRALADHQPVDAAVISGRKALMPLTATDLSIDWGTPVLFMNAEDGMLWPSGVQTEMVQAGLEEFARQTAQFAQADQPTPLVQGLSRYVERLWEQSAQTSSGGPYRGLLTYRLGDAEIFFGRDRDIKLFLDHLNRSPLTILHAESGAGKSSLLQAGIIPRLIVQEALPILIRAHNISPTLALKRFLVSNVEDETELLSESLRNFLHRIIGILGSKIKLYVFLDQFEEFFSLLDEKTQNKFINELAECLEDETLDICWVLALRSEYFGNLANFRPRIPRLFTDNDHRLNRLSLKEAYAVIRKPAELYGIQFADGLIQRIVDDLNHAAEDRPQMSLESDEGVVPSQLQLVCLALYEEREDEQTIIDHALYERLGGVGGILKSHLERVLRRGLPADQRGTARYLLEALITSQTRRIMRTRSELIAELSNHQIMDTTIDEVIEQMVDARLLRVTDSHDEIEPVYELAHDYLIDEIELSPEVQSRKAAEELLKREILNWRLFGVLIGARQQEIINLQRDRLYFDDIAAQVVIRSALENDLDIQPWFQVGSPDLVREVLIDCSTSGHARAVRLRAITSLTEYYNEQVEQVLAEIATTDPDAAVHNGALDTLAACGSPSAQQIALANLQQTDPEIRRHGAMILADYSDPEVERALFTVITLDEAYPVWTEALSALDAQGVDSWLPLLEASPVRQAAIYQETMAHETLELSGPAKYRLLLVHLLHIGHAQVQHHPIMAISLVLFVASLFFATGNAFYNRWLDNHWSRYPANISQRKLLDVVTVDDQILIGSYHYGPSWFYQEQWQTGLLNDFPECQQGVDSDDPNANMCTIYRVGISKDSLPYALISTKGLYRYEQTTWVSTARQDRQGNFISLEKAPNCPPGLVRSACQPLAVYDDQLLLLAGDQTGILASNDQGETWDSLGQIHDLLAGEFSSVHFDAKGRAYAGGADGLYRGSGDYPWTWEVLPIKPDDAQTIAVKQMAIGSFQRESDIETYLYLETIVEINGRKRQQIGCYGADSRAVGTPQLLPITNRLLYLLQPQVGAQAIIPHPEAPEIFYMADNFGAIYEMSCDGTQSRIGQKPLNDVVPSSLAVWQDENGEFYLLWASRAGLFQYNLLQHKLQGN